MKLKNILCTIVLCCLLTSCHSHRHVVRGDQGKSKQKIEKLVQSKLTGTSDNEYTKTLLTEAYGWLGTPYKYGGNSKKGTDCSGFVTMVYHDALSIDLPRVSREQGEYCRKINKKDLFPGDLVFFAIGKSGSVNHVGLYVGGGKMIHASSSKGIMVSDIADAYFTKHYHHSGQVVQYHDLIKGKKNKKTKKQRPPKDAIELPSNLINGVFETPAYYNASETPDLVPVTTPDPEEPQIFE